VFRRSLELLKAGLRKTRQLLLTDVRDLFRIGRRVDEAMLAELEERLLGADVGVDTADKVLARVREVWKDREIKEREPELLLGFVKQALADELSLQSSTIELQSQPPTVILVVGVNGAGKTTSIAKLAYHYHHIERRKVLVAACDTFRAAAVEQLTIWAERIGCDIIKQPGAKPAAVAFDALERARARQYDVLIVDTAGRLHTQANLMQELEKIQAVIAKQLVGAPHEVLLVLDGTTGQNAVVQAQQFSAVVRVTGIFLTKIDGTAKGGVALRIMRDLRIPVKFIGVGEGLEHIQPFEPRAYLDALFDAN
jgi:fused signal recognition particle receptor